MVQQYRVACVVVPTKWEVALLYFVPGTAAVVNDIFRIILVVRQTVSHLPTSWSRPPTSWSISILYGYSPWYKRVLRLYCCTQQQQYHEEDPKNPVTEKSQKANKEGHTSVLSSQEKNRKSQKKSTYWYVLGCNSSRMFRDTKHDTAVTLCVVPTKEAAACLRILSVISWEKYGNRQGQSVTQENNRELLRKRLLALVKQQLVTKLSGAKKFLPGIR